MCFVLICSSSRSSIEIRCLQNIFKENRYCSMINGKCHPYYQNKSCKLSENKYASNRMAIAKIKMLKIILKLKVFKCDREENIAQKNLF